MNKHKEVIRLLESINNELHNLNIANQSKSRTKKDKEIYNQLRGFRNALLLDACSGVGYIYEGKFYNNLTDIEEDIENLKEELIMDKVISVNYLIHFIDQIIER